MFIMNLRNWLKYYHERESCSDEDLPYFSSNRHIMENIDFLQKLKLTAKCVLIYVIFYCFLYWNNLSIWLPPREFDTDNLCPSIWLTTWCMFSFWPVLPGLKRLAIIEVRVSLRNCVNEKGLWRVMMSWSPFLNFELYSRKTSISVQKYSFLISPKAMHTRFAAFFVTCFWRYSKNLSFSLMCHIRHSPFPP